MWEKNGAAQEERRKDLARLRVRTASFPIVFFINHQHLSESNWFSHFGCVICLCNCMYMHALESRSNLWAIIVWRARANFSSLFFAFMWWIHHNSPSMCVHIYPKEHKTISEIINFKSDALSLLKDLSRVFFLEFLVCSSLHQKPAERGPDKCLKIRLK